MKDKLNELNIFALRDFARRTGVASPTSKKKEDLIKEIMEILKGEKKPEVAKSKQGRPPKVFGYSFANVFNFEESDTSKQTLNQAVVEFENDNNILTVAGCVELVNNNCALLWVEKNYKNENYFISSEVIGNAFLKMGDRVVAEVSLDESVKIVKKIFSINDCPLIKMSQKRIDYYSIEHNLPNRNLNFDKDSYKNLGLKFGENIYVYGSNNNDNTTSIINLMNSCEIENKLYINISVADKNKILLSNIGFCEKFVSNITDDVEMSRRTVFLATERAKRILEIGEDVLLVVDDISSIFGIDKDGLNLVKNLVSITKEANKGSITILAVMPNESFNQIEKLADQRLKIENGIILK